MKKAKGCLRTAAFLILIMLAVRLLSPSFFSKQTVNFYIRYFVLKQMFKGPLEDWWGEMVRSALVEKRGNVIYAGLGTTMGVFSLEENGKLKLIKKIPLLGFAHGFTQEGNVLYVAAGATGLHIFNVTDAENPKFISRYLTDGYGLGIAVSKGYAYLGDEENGLVILNVKNPEKLVEVSHIKKGNVNFVLVEKNIAYLADGYRGVVMYDVKNPAKPKYLGVAQISYKSKPKSIDVPPLGLALYKHYLLAANGERGLHILDVKNPRRPKTIRSIHPDSTLGWSINGFLPAFTYSVLTDGSTAYIADIVNGVVAVDVKNPKMPKFLRTIKTSGQAFDVTLRGKKLVVSAGAGGLHVLDMAQDAKISGSYAETPTTFGIAMDTPRHLVFTANGSGGIKIYNVKNPSMPELLSHLPTPGYAHRITLSGALAYVADVIGGCQVVDIQNPRAPKIIHQFDYQQHPWDVDVSGKYAFIADAHHGFSVFDISHPAGAKFVSNYDLKRYSVGVEVEGKYAYVADLASFLFTKGGLFIFDISSPRKPKLLGSLAARGLDVAVNDKILYLAAYNNGLLIVDAKNPEKPEILSRYKTGGYVYGVHLDKAGKKLYAADYKKGALQFDAANPSHPHFEKTYRTRGTAYDVIPYENVLFVADGKEGLTVLDARSGKITFPKK